MTHWKLVVPHTITQIFLYSCIYYILLHALNPCKPSTPLVIDDNLLMVLAIATMMLTFAVGWGVMAVSVWILHPLLFLPVMITASVINSWLWNELYTQWRAFWDRFEERRNRLSL